MNTTVAAQLPAEALRRLHELAAQSGRSQTECIADAALEHLADAEALRIAEQRMREVESGESDTVLLETVMKEFLL